MHTPKDKAMATVQKAQLILESRPWQESGWFQCQLKKRSAVVVVPYHCTACFAAVRQPIASQNSPPHTVWPMCQLPVLSLQEKCPDGTTVEWWILIHLFQGHVRTHAHTHIQWCEKAQSRRTKILHQRSETTPSSPNFSHAHKYVVKIRQQCPFHPTSCPAAPVNFEQLRSILNSPLVPLPYNKAMFISLMLFNFIFYVFYCTVLFAPSVFLVPNWGSWPGNSIRQAHNNKNLLSIIRTDESTHR